MAAASLGQVHRARLRSGRDVVVKVQRPDAREVIRSDMETMARVAELADRRTEVGRRYGFSSLLAQFRRALAGELDYVREARNPARFVELTADYDLLVVVDDDAPSGMLTLAAGYEARRGFRRPADVVPCRESTFRRRARLPGTLCHTAATEGIVVYERR